MLASHQHSLGNRGTTTGTTTGTNTNTGSNNQNPPVPPVLTLAQRIAILAANVDIVAGNVIGTSISSATIDLFTENQFAILGNPSSGYLSKSAGTAKFHRDDAKDINEQEGDIIGGGGGVADWGGTGGGGTGGGGTNGEGTGEALDTQSVANDVASKLGGNVSKIDGDVNSWKVTVPNGKRSIIVRIMEAGVSLIFQASNEVVRRNL